MISKVILSVYFKHYSALLLFYSQLVDSAFILYNGWLYNAEISENFIWKKYGK